MMNPESVRDILLKTKLGKYFKASNIDHLLKHNKLIDFEAGYFILQQGKKSPGIFIIIDGKVSVMAKILGEGSADIAELTCGDIIGEISVLENDSCGTSALTETPVTCLLISTAYFEMISLFYPKLKFKLTKAISNEICLRLQDLHTKIRTYMKTSHMVTQLFFGKVLKTFVHHPTTITLEDAEIDHDELRHVTLFHGFSDAEYDELMQAVTVIKTPKYCNLINTDEKSFSCYIIIRGAVQSSIIENDISAKLSALGPLKLFSNMLLMDKVKNSYVDYTTCERAILFKISHDYIVALPKKNPRLWYKLFGLMCQSFSELEKAAKKLDVRLNSETYNR
jgi:CRP-like cAMP-binding protein